MDAREDSQQGFAINEGYKMRMDKVLYINQGVLQLSDHSFENKLRAEFENQYKTKLVDYINKFEEERKRIELQQLSSME